MKYNDREPIYLQIMNDIKYQIVLGNLKADERLLSIKEQSECMGVNPNTIARVYTELERERIVHKEKGLGTFVTSDENVITQLKHEIAEENIKRFVDRMRKIGISKTDMKALLVEYLNRTKKVDEQNEYREG
ncbi:MAG: GntR family transcriptional regulator [Clostridiales bacterium]|nr:GntR family transcriptional regulator [Clostridiales bacterium]